MNHFDLNKVLEHWAVKPEDVAPVLFPRVKYPKSALDRILRGEAYLDTIQLEALAAYLGVLVTDLFGVGSWKGVQENGRLVLLKGEYRVVLNYEEAMVCVHKGSELVYEFLAPVRFMTVKNFIKELNNQLKIYENGNN